MRKTALTLLLFLFIIVLFGWRSSSPENHLSSVRNYVLNELRAIRPLLLSGISHPADTAFLRKEYRAARMHYKHAEFFIEYVSPREAKFYINGPLVPKHDEENGKLVVYPRGFQRIEELLYTSMDPDTALLCTQYRLLAEQLDALSSYYEDISLEEGQLLEMCQLQLFRIAAMGLNGYDATISHDNVQESLWSLEGVEETVKAFHSLSGENKNAASSYRALIRQLHTSENYMHHHPGYADFPRLEFITEHINTLNRQLVAFHTACGLPWSERKQALNLQKEFLFGRESFNLRFFSMYYDDTLLLDKQSELGRLLFFDPILSAGHNRSCSTCHDASKNFTDGLERSIPLEAGNNPLRNAPSLWNVAFQKAFFYDGKAYQLEQQVFDVVHNRREMGSSLLEAAILLRRDTAYRKLFAAAFAGSPDTAITSYAIQKAITEYEKTLVSFNSRFDQYLRGDQTALSEREISGYNLFAGKALCASCHFFPLFNGTVPPSFTDSEFEVIGIASDPSNKMQDDDKGRYSITGLPEQLYAFKTPTLRNVAQTAPYMHNGAYTTLEEVVEFYHRGGGRGFGFDIPNQTLPFDSLQLNDHEKEDIVLFMKALSDTSGSKTVR